MASMFAPTQRSGSITPFGAAVEPLVNCRIASRSGSSGGRTSASAPSRAPSATSASSSTTGAWAAPGASSGDGSRNGARSGSTTTSPASALAMRLRVCSTNSSIDPRRIGRGSATTVPPARKVAWMVVTRARVVGPRMPTWMPGPTPRAWSAAAMPRASSWTRDHSTRSAASVPPPADPTNVTVAAPSAAVSRRETTEGITPLTRVGPPGLPVGSAPRVPVGDALHRRAHRGLEVGARRCRRPG